MVITIGRQYGSGGREIGRRTAERLGVPFYDREILREACKKKGFSEEVVSQFDEKPTGSFLYTAYLGAAATADNLPLNQKVALAQFEVIRDLANRGSCVIVGRCADYVLRSRSDVYSVFIHADKAIRVKRAVEEYGVPAALAEKVVKKEDRKRADYYSFYTQQKWGDATRYHLTVDSGTLGIDGAVDAICNLVKPKEG